MSVKNSTLYTSLPMLVHEFTEILQQKLKKKERKTPLGQSILEKPGAIKLRS